MDQEKIGSNLANRYIEWKFSPPAAPHFGGAWERLIKSAKAAFRIVANKQTITDEVFRSFMVRVEALLNDRPLTDVPVDPKEPVALSPSHFLIGQLIDNALPETEDNSHSKLSAKSWKKAQTMATHFWRRWMKEYLPNLIERRKWMTPRRNLAVNDLVLVVDPATPRGGVADWPCPRDSPDPDGVVRSATVVVWSGNDTFCKYTVRPVVKLCLLEEAAPKDDSDSENGVLVSRNRAGDVDDGTGFLSLPTEEKRP